MNESKTAGCSVLTILAVLGAIAVAVVALAAVLYTRARTVNQQQDHKARVEKIAFASAGGDERRGVTLSADAVGRYSPAEFGAGLTREHFVAIMSDGRATALARQAFAERANGQVVRWLLKAAEVRAASDPDRLEAELQLPYRIKTGPNGWTGSSLVIRAEFPPDQRDRLLGIRREDWATVEGRLQLDGANIRLLDARVVMPGDPVRAEH